jgi:hypothetical protein
MTEPTDYLQWSKTCPPDSYTITQVVPDSTTAEPVIQVECRAPSEPPPAPLINGKVVAGDIEWDVELSAWVLEDVEVAPLPKNPLPSGS